MSIEITHVRYGGTSKTHESIDRYKWRNEQDGNIGDSDKPAMINWIDNKDGTAHVGQGSSRAEVGTVHPSNGAPYLRTYADGDWTNNLLSLPTF